MHSERRFASRARALSILRVPFLLGGLLLWMSPSARLALGLESTLLPLSLGLPSSAPLFHSSSLVGLGPIVRVRASLDSYCVYAVSFAFWVAVTGRLRSSILPFQLLLTSAAVLLFSRPLYALPSVG